MPAMCPLYQDLATDLMVYSLVRQVERKDAMAMAKLGCMYGRGDRVSRNLEQAFYWSMMAAKRGIDSAQYIVGTMLYNGEGTQRDEAAAAKWYLKAARRGFIPAQGYLGAMYIFGMGVDQNYVEAVFWLTKATEKNHVQSQYLLDKGVVFYKIMPGLFIGIVVLP
ncbi:hypothetical protein DFQ26_006787 [Actinomortierella ambigua]|nr:hypothetical protein DFQ26_006787 [Actinomortierella ambigua]